MLSIPKKLLQTVKNKIKKESWQLVEKQKSYSESKKCPKKSTYFGFKIHKGAGILKKTDTEHKTNYMECLNSRNKNIKGGGSL